MDEEACGTSVEIDTDHAEGRTEVSDVVEGGFSVESLKGTEAVNEKKAVGFIQGEQF